MRVVAAWAGDGECGGKGAVGIGRALLGGSSAAKVPLWAVQSLPQQQQGRASRVRPASAAPLPKDCECCSVNAHIGRSASVAPILSQHGSRGGNAVSAQIGAPKPQRIAHGKGRARQVHGGQGLLVAQAILLRAAPAILAAGISAGIGLRGAGAAGPGEGAIGCVHCSALGNAGARGAGHQLQHKVGSEGVDEAGGLPGGGVGAHCRGKVAGACSSQRRGSVGRPTAPGGP